MPNLYSLETTSFAYVLNKVPNQSAPSQSADQGLHCKISDKYEGPRRCMYSLYK